MPENLSDCTKRCASMAVRTLSPCSSKGQLCSSGGESDGTHPTVSPCSTCSIEKAAQNLLWRLGLHPVAWDIRRAAPPAMSHLDIGVDGAQGDAVLVKERDHLGEASSRTMRV
jgi:hypothetical protein